MWFCVAWLNLEGEDHLLAFTHFKTLKHHGRLFLGFRFCDVFLGVGVDYDMQKPKIDCKLILMESAKMWL